jgi:hypothetical protein
MAQKNGNGLGIAFDDILDQVVGHNTFGRWYAVHPHIPLQLWQSLLGQSYHTARLPPMILVIQAWICIPICILLLYPGTLSSDRFSLRMRMYYDDLPLPWIVVIRVESSTNQPAASMSTWPDSRMDQPVKRFLSLVPRSWKVVGRDLQ